MTANSVCSHQDHGLKFMLQREAEEKDQLYSLWERIPGQEDIGFVSQSVSTMPGLTLLQLPAQNYRSQESITG